MLNPGGDEKSRPIMPMSTSAALGLVPALEGGLVSIAMRGSSTVVGEEWGGGEGLDRWSINGSGAGASSMCSEREVVDMLSECMMGGDVQHMAAGCLL